MVDLAVEARRIRAALPPPERGGFEAHAARLLDALGYRSDLALPGQDGSADWFFANVGRDIPVAKAEREFREHAASVRILFQVTDDEIRQSAQPMLMEGGAFNPGNARSFIFAAVELTGDGYTRGRYADFTRVINKRVNAPCVVLFRNKADRVSLAFVHRRPNKRDPKRAVLGSVSLVREVDAANPHRAHVDILADLSLDERLRWMDAHAKPHDFDGLMAAWLDALDTEALNKRFYRELFRWFQRAVETARFPVGDRLPTAEEHAIRLITRMLFIWFVKEKELVAEELFVEHQVRGLLKDYDAANGDSYYRAVLQNLFFATLNTEIFDKEGKPNRKFSAEAYDTHRDFTRYRYAAEIADRERLLSLFARSPFINGGLFDCLDSFEGTRSGGIRIDYFSDNVIKKGTREYAKLSIPNRLFFDSQGLIALFNRYKFTVEENTPAEEEVALDPELLGRVFENLLAAVNSETRETARKQTGSYYTPRPVVDYMVDEALVAALAAAVPPADGDAAFLEERLRYLLDYKDAFEDAAELFDANETERAIEAIADLRVLDPAVGSGAFPMGILHKLTLALRRLDPENEHWKELQKERARADSAETYNIDDQNQRDAAQREISALFQRYRDSDFGRKLYLIQNSIYGVDIQPVATQIAKLRFFISLAIEQRPTTDPRANFGIRPLPNLETRFVAADTLRSVRSVQEPLRTSAVEQLERELAANRERYFHVGDRDTKHDLRKADARLRADLSKELRASGLSAPSAKRVADWDPYDQTAKAAWFDPEYMFNVADGFDIVIANPPYISVENLQADMREYLLDNYMTCEGRTDIYIAFLEKGMDILKDEGNLCFIVSSAFATQQYGAKMRRQMIERHAIRQLVDATAYRIFENAVVFNFVVNVGKAKNQALTRVRTHRSNDDFDNRTGDEFLVDQSFFATLKDNRFDSNPDLAGLTHLKEKIWQKAIRLEQICFVAYGARLNHRAKNIGKAHYIMPSLAGGAKPFCEGKNIERYSFSQEGWLRYTPSEHYNPMFPELFESEKLMTVNVVGDRVRFSYDSKGFYNSHTVINCVRLDLLREATHRSARKAVKSANIALASQFNYKYLLAIVNSRLTNWYFVNFLSERLHFYPNDAKQLPIPQASEAEQAPFVALVDEILAAKARDPRADTSAPEAEIDRLVYALYGLTDAEARAVAG